MKSFFSPPYAVPTPDELQEQIERMTRQNNENRIKIDGLAQTVSDLKKEVKNFHQFPSGSVWLCGYPDDFALGGA